MTTRTKWIATAATLAAIAVIVFLVARELGDPLVGGQGGGVERRVTAAAPAGQPPVALASVDGFRQVFNDAASEARLVVMLSPT